MKSLYIVRHAKSSWGNLTLSDFDRPLNDRGKTDAPMIAQRLLKDKIKIDIFISSPAKRALKTCKIFCKEYNKDEKAILEIDELYHAAVETFYKVVTAIPDEFETAAIFSHNPGITDFVNSLGTDIKVDNMPTCAVFGVELNAANWKDFSNANKKFVLFQYPKLV